MQITQAQFPGADPIAQKKRLLVATQRLLAPVSLVLLFFVTFDARLDMSPALFVAMELALIVGAYFLLPRTHYRTFFLYIVCFTLFIGVRAVADETGIPVSYSYPVQLDSALFGVNPSAWLQDRLYTPGSLGFLEWFLLVVYSTYFVGHFVFSAILWRVRPDLLTPCAAAIVLTLFLGLLVYTVLPTSPPWLAAEHGDAPEIIRVAKASRDPVWADAYNRGSHIASENDVGAMPSLHAAITVVMALTLWRFGRIAKVAGVAYVGSMGFALVYLGEHYVADVLGGILVAVVAWVGVQAWSQRRNNVTDLEILSTRLLGQQLVLENAEVTKKTA